MPIYTSAVALASHRHHTQQDARILVSLLLSTFGRAGCAEGDCVIKQERQHSLSLGDET